MSERKLVHTERVDQEVVLDFVDIPGVRLVLRIADPHVNVQEIHLPTSQADFTEFP